MIGFRRDVSGRFKPRCALLGAVAAALLALPLIGSDVHAAGYYNLGGFWRPTCREMDSTWAPAWGNLVGYWKLNGTGSIASGTPIWPVAGPIGFAEGSGMTYAPGRDNQGIVFNGTSDTIELPNTPQLNLSGNTVTVSAWINQTAGGTAEYQTIFYNGANGASNLLSYEMSYDATGANLRFVIGDGNGNFNAASAPAPTTGGWHLAVGVADGSTVWLYIDGVEVGSTAQTIATLGANTNGYCIGNMSYTGTCDNVTFFDGTLDEIAVWNTALSAAQVLTLYTNQSGCRGVSPPPTLAFTSASQTLTSGTCSGEATVSYENSSGTPTAPGSNITVTLSGNDFTFYQDAACSTPITSVTIPSSGSSANFYMESTGSNYIITGSATGIQPAMQVETINSGTSFSGFHYVNGSYTGGTIGDWSDYFGDAWPGSSVVFNGQLFMGAYNEWMENNTEVFIYNGNDSSPSWSDSNGGNSMTYGNEGSSAMLATYGNALYAVWAESGQIRVKSYNGVTQCSGSYWCQADSGSLNYNTAQTAENPSITTYNGNLYVIWDESTSAGNNQTHVAVYNGGTSWSRIDDNGHDGTNGTSMNFVSSSCAIEPSIYGTSQGLIAMWLEGPQCNDVRAKIYNGTSWAQADNGTQINVNETDQYWQNNIASFTAFDDKIYGAWMEYGNDGASSIRVMVYGGAGNWTEVDGNSGTGLQYEAAAWAKSPSLVAFQGRLYAAWSECDTTTDISYCDTQTRLAVYNGNDSAPSWTDVIGPNTDGMDYVPWEDGAAIGQPALTALNNKLYIAWDDSEGIDTAAFTQGTTPTQLWFPAYVDTTGDTEYETAGCIADEVRTADANGNPAVTSAAVTVTLSATGLTFYEDDLCTVPLTSNQVTIPAGDSGTHFFFLITTSGTGFNLLGSATGSGLESSSQTLSDTLNDVWVGGESCTGVWSDHHCWSNGVPGQYATAIFDSTCTVNCNATINENPQINNILLESGYSYTVTLGTNVTASFDGLLEIESGNFTLTTGTLNSGQFLQTGGAFNGGSASINVTGGNFQVNGGSFTSTSGTLLSTTGGDLDNFYISSSATFSNANGTIQFGDGGNQNDIYVDVPSATLYNVTFEENNWNPTTVVGTLNVAGYLIINNGPNESGAGAPLNGGTIAAQGNVYLEQGQGGTATLLINGSGNQTITSSGGSYPIQNIEIASTGGTVSLSGNFENINSWTVTSGNVNAGSSTVYFGDGNDNGVAYSVNSGSMVFNNVQLLYGEEQSMTVTGTMNIGGTLDLGYDNTSTLNGGTINLTGNLVVWTGGGGTTAFEFTGGNAQTYSQTGGTMPTGGVTIAKTTGTSLTLENNFTAGAGLTITSGTLNTNGKNLTVSGDVLIDDTLTGSAGTIVVGGSWTDNGTFTPSTSTVKFTNSSAESPFVIGGDSALTFDNLTIDATGSATTGEQGSAITVNGNLTITAGTLNSQGYDVTVGGNFSNSGTYTSGSNTFTLTSGASHTFSGSSTSFNNLVMDDSGNTAADTITFQKSKTYTVSELTLKGNSTNRLKLRSSTAGTQWKVNPTGWSVSHVDVQDSDNLASSAIAPANSLDSGDNTNWGFTYNSPSYRQSVATAVPGSNCTACASATLGSSTLANSLIVVAVVNGNGGSASSVTDNATSGSNSYSLAATKTNTGTAEIWYAVGVNSGATAVTVNYSSGTKPAIYVYEFTSTGTSNPVDKTATGSGTSTSLAANATASFTNEVVVSVSYGAKPLTATGSFTALTVEAGTTPWYGDSSYAVESTAGSYGGTWTQTSSATWAETTVTFRGSNQ